MSFPKNHTEMYWRVIDSNDPSTFPHTDDFILLSFSNYNIPTIGRCEGDDDEGFVFFEGDDDKPLVKFGLFVNAWMPLPERSES